MKQNPFTVHSPFATEYAQHFTSTIPAAFCCSLRRYARYLGIFTDRWYTWQTHIVSKPRTPNDHYRLVRPLLTSKHVKLRNKLVLYKLLLRPPRTSGIQQWGAAKMCNINRTQRFQSKALGTYYFQSLVLCIKLHSPFWYRNTIRLWNSQNSSVITNVSTVV